jgi:hypothetical protein
MSQSSTPYTFAEYPHTLDLKLTPEEAEALYDGYVNELFLQKVGLASRTPF